MRLVSIFGLFQSKYKTIMGVTIANVLLEVFDFQIGIQHACICNEDATDHAFSISI